MDLEEAIALGRQLKVEDIEHFNYDDLMLLAMRRGVETEYILPGTHNLLQAIVNHQSGPTSTLWGKPLPKRAVDGFEDPKDTLNNHERNIDAVLVFDISPRDDVGLDSSWDRRETNHSYEKRLHVLKCLYAKGLELTQSLSFDQTQWVIRISAPKDLLEITAQRMGEKFKTKLKNTQEEKNAGLLNGYAIFQRDKKVCYDMYLRGFFTSIERQRIILYLIEKALGGDGEDFAAIKKAENTCLFHLFPTHDPQDQADLNRLWCSLNAFCSFSRGQPLDLIRDYYGEEISIYFAFLGLYTTFLFFPAMLGLLTWVVQLTVDHDTVLVPVYVCFVALWSIVFLEYWKRYQAILQLRWNVREFEDQEVNRIEFSGDLRVSPITGEDEEYFSDEERCQRYMLTQPIMALAIVVVVIAAVGIVLFQYFAVHSGTFGNSGTYVAGGVNAAVIQIMNMVYAVIAEEMNKHENHQTATDYTDALITKVFVFQFVNSYAAITYMAFASGRFPVFGVDLRCTRNGCLSDIHNLICTSLLLQIFVGNITEVASPWIFYKLDEYQRSSASMENQGTGRAATETTPLTGVINAVNPWYDEDDEMLQQGAINDGFTLPPYISKHEKEAHMPVYENTFNDYNELVIQFGYVVIFGLALPLGAFLCWCNNCIEIRSDGFKLVNVYQRPFYRGAQDIGTWFQILQGIVVIGVLVNCCMMAFTSNIFLRDHWVDANNVGVVEMLVGIFIAEHTALIVMVFCADFIPDTPASIAIDEERLRDKVEDVLRTQDDEDKSRDTLRIYTEMQQLIDDNDIALLEDIAIRKWRRTRQYGSGMLAGIGPPEVKDGEQAGQPSKWMDIKNRMDARAAEKKEKIFEYDLY